MNLFDERLAPKIPILVSQAVMSWGIAFHCCLELAVAVPQAVCELPRCELVKGAELPTKTGIVNGELLWIE